ncbi:MFS transporter [Flavisphingomonas formosensis]|uniref:MFS transporter n=1 Tax=Flavisphingomonas formosensis TaxID=861534 RepID=UPI0018DF01DE|nr:MFS transporter [Sphingomonas formosensis]
MDDGQSAGTGETAPLGAMGKASLLFSSLLSVYAIVGLAVVLPKIAAHFADVPDAPALVRFLFNAVSLAMIFGAPLATLLTERYGRRRVLIGAAILYGIAGMAGALVDNIWILIGTRLVLGLVTAINSTLHITLLLTAFDESRRNRWIGIFSMVGTLCAVATFPIAGALGSIDWRLPFAMHLIAVPQLLLILAGVPDSPRATRPTDRAANRRAAAGAGFPAMLVLIALVTGIVAGGHSSFVSFHLADIGVTDTNKISLGLLIGTLAGAVTAFAFGMLREHASNRSLYCAAFALAGAGVIGIGMAASLAGVMAAQIVAGFGIGLLSPCLYALVAITGRPEDRARNTGYAKSAFYGAPFIAQLGLEPVARLMQAGGALIALGSFGLIIAALLLVARPDRIAAA